MRRASRYWPGTFWRREGDGLHHAFRRSEPRGEFRTLCAAFGRLQLGLGCLRPARVKARCVACNAAEQLLVGADKPLRGKGRLYRWTGRRQECAACKLQYSRFRTGYSYKMVFEMLMDYHEDSTRWTYKRRSHILGVWHALKLRLWKEHQALCARAKRKLSPRKMKKVGRKMLIQAFYAANPALMEAAPPF